MEKKRSSELGKKRYFRDRNLVKERKREATAAAVKQYQVAERENSLQRK